MTAIRLVIALHVGMGVAWALSTLAVAIAGRAGGAWPAIMLGTALLNMLAGIDLWHQLHAGPWGPREHLLVVGTFCAFVALGMQAPAVLAAPRGDRLQGASLFLVRSTLVLILAAAAAMLASASA